MEDWKTYSIITLLSIPVIVIIFFAMWGIRFSQVGEGEHSGFITAVDQRGYFFRNYDVYFKTDNSSSQEDLYCINRSNTKLIDQVKEANKNREQVTIQYHGVRGLGLSLCKGTEIDSVEVK